MANRKITLKDSTGADNLYPATFTSQVFNEDGENVDTLLRNNLPKPVNFGTISSLPQTITDSEITSTMELPPDGGWYASNTSAIVGEWSVTTSDGSVTVNGTISGSTTLVLWLYEHR